MVLVLKFLLPNHIHSTLILKELEELLEYKHNSWIFDIAPKAYIYYSYKLMFFFSLGTLKVYLMYEEKKKFTTLLVSTASPRPDEAIKSASR